MKIYKVYCDYCGELQSVSENTSKRMSGVTIQWGVDDELNFEICSKCKDSIKKQLEIVKDKTISREKQLMDNFENIMEEGRENMKEQLFEVIVGNDKVKIICRQINGLFQDINTNCVYGSSIVSYKGIK